VGGTGITPAYQTLKHLQGAPSDTSPKVSIIYSSPSPPNILLRDELDKMVFDDPFRVKVKYLVDQMEGVKDGELVLGRVNTKLIEETIGRGGGEKRRVVVVCGPEGWVPIVSQLIRS
jgi:cytochrome-b5 reductase